MAIYMPRFLNGGSAYQMSQPGVTGHCLSLKPGQRRLPSALGHIKQIFPLSCSSPALFQCLSTPGPTGLHSCELLFNSVCISNINFQIIPNVQLPYTRWGG